MFKFDKLKQAYKNDNSVEMAYIEAKSDLIKLSRKYKNDTSINAEVQELYESCMDVLKGQKSKAKMELAKSHEGWK